MSDGMLCVLCVCPRVPLWIWKLSCPLRHRLPQENFKRRANLRPLLTSPETFKGLFEEVSREEINSWPNGVVDIQVCHALYRPNDRVGALNYGMARLTSSTVCGAPAGSVAHLAAQKHPGLPGRKVGDRDVLHDPSLSQHHGVLCATLRRSVPRPDRDRGR